MYSDMNIRSNNVYRDINIRSNNMYRDMNKSTPTVKKKYLFSTFPKGYINWKVIISPNVVKAVS